MKIRLLSALMVTVLSGCGGSSGGAGAGATVDTCSELSSDTFSCSQMLTDLVEQGVRPVSAQLTNEATIMHDAVDAYCDPLIDSDSDVSSTLTTAQGAWSNAYATLQQLAVMQFGPLANSDTGMNTLYAWPEVSSCNIDRQVTTGTLGSSNKSGLFAMEYLLFGNRGTVSCTDSQAVEQWAAGLTILEIQQAQCSYLKLVADDFVTETARLNSEWNSYDLSTAGSTLQAAAGKVTDALFYIDKQTKDAKIKAALPQATDESFDATVLESQFANDSKEAIIANLQGAKRILIANDSAANTGFDDYFAALGRDDITTDMVTALDQAIANAQAIDGTIYAALSGATDENVQSCINYANDGQYSDGLSDLMTFCALQYNIKTFTDLLKGKFTEGTGFSIPASADGDAD